MNKSTNVDRESFLQAREFFSNPAEKVSANEVQFQDNNNNSDSYFSAAGPCNGNGIEEGNISNYNKFYGKI